MTPLERVDPQAVPHKTLADGSQLPAIGMGTFGSDSVSADSVAHAVKIALEMGWRHFDCAAVYRNEAAIGEALDSAMQNGLRREELWVTSKLWNDSHGAQVERACEATLRDLGLDELDLYLVHWPFPNHHGPGVGVDSRDPHAVPYRHEQFMTTWRAMERLVRRGLVRSIGTSNMTIPKLDRLFLDAEIRPVVNQMECHPHFQQPELFRYLIDHHVQPVGFSPLGSPGRPERDRTAEDTVCLEDPVLVDIAAGHGWHPATVCLKWAFQRGQIPIPFSVNPKNLLANLRAVVTEPLSPDEMTALGRLDKRCRLIKGQVFLWRTARGWEDLWDPNGVIVS